MQPSIKRHPKQRQDLLPHILVCKRQICFPSLVKLKTWSKERSIIKLTLSLIIPEFYLLYNDAVHRGEPNNQPRSQGYQSRLSQLPKILSLPSKYVSLQLSLKIIFTQPRLFELWNVDSGSTVVGSSPWFLTICRQSPFHVSGLLWI